MDRFLTITQVVLAVLLITTVLLQHRGTALGGAFGGEGNIYRSRRGAEKFLFIFTVIIACLFIATALLNLAF